jgi:predicted lipoprotein with Yx(FWY)xxD motif
MIINALAASVIFSSAQAAERSSAQAPQAQLPQSPVAVAMLEEKEGFVFRRFPSRHRLYTFDQDPIGKSVCVDGCDFRWQPLVAPADAKAIGDWTPIARNDGRLQWAYRGKAVYSRYHDDPDSPGGDGVEPGWRMLPHMTRAQLVGP